MPASSSWPLPIWLITDMTPVPVPISTTMITEGMAITSWTISSTTSRRRPWPRVWRQESLSL